MERDGGSWQRVSVIAHGAAWFGSPFPFLPKFTNPLPDLVDCLQG